MRCKAPLTTLLTTTAVSLALVVASAHAGETEKRQKTPFATAYDDAMMMPLHPGTWDIEPVFTIGETLPSATTGDYTPAGVLDGLGAFRKDGNTVRVLANHELGYDRGSSYAVSDGKGGSFTLSGARVSYFDIDVKSKQIVDSGLAIERIYGADGNLASDASFLANNLPGLSRLCSSQLVEARQFRRGRGLRQSMYLTGEEDGGSYNPVGGAAWALDPKTGSFWAIPAFGRGAWENITQVDTGSRRHIAFILSDDSSPFDADGDGVAEAAPLYLYVGKKSRQGDFLARNGLRDGKLFVWVPDDGASVSPIAFNGSGNTLAGHWVEVDNAPTGTPSEDGSSGYDEYGYPTQRTLWGQAEAAGAFRFSRPEDVSTNPKRGKEFVLASTGVDTFDVDPATGNGADTFGTIYTMTVRFDRQGMPKASRLEILYDGDADPDRRLRSPDNLDWADDGYIYIQEDKAEDDTLTGEPLFGPGAVNPNEAQIVRIHPKQGEVDQIAQIDRSVVLDPTTTGTPFDTDAGDFAEWESSGILDVSKLFRQKAGTLFLFDVQAHGIEDQTAVNADSRINDSDLVEGGQLLLLEKAGHSGHGGPRKPR